MKKGFSIMILILSIAFAGITGCSSTENGTNETVLSNKYVDLQTVETGDGFKVLVDNTTGVLYLWYKDSAQYGQVLTPLYNEDGSLKNISDCQPE